MDHYPPFIQKQYGRLKSFPMSIYTKLLAIHLAPSPPPLSSEVDVSRHVTMLCGCHFDGSSTSESMAWADAISLRGGCLG